MKALTTLKLKATSGRRRDGVPSRSVGLLASAAVLVLACPPVSSLAQQGRPDGEKSKPTKSWAIFVRGGALHQFETDIDDGGDFSVSRLFIQPGARFLVGPTTSIAFTVGYGHNDYDFSGDRGFAGLHPWSSINTLRFSIPVRWSPDDKWTVFGFPTLRFAAEDGGKLADGATAGALIGLSYKFSETFSIGPGFGVLGQIEDDISLFPILVIDWQLTDTLRLTTGRGVAASRGPGLTLEWRPTGPLSFGLSVRREKLRFRLDDSGIAPDGVGQDRSFPVSVSMTYRLNRGLRFSLLGGMEFAGKLRLEDDRGKKIRSTDYDPAPFLGFSFRAAF